MVCPTDCFCLCQDNILTHCNLIDVLFLRGVIARCITRVFLGSMFSVSALHARAGWKTPCALHSQSAELSDELHRQSPLSRVWICLLFLDSPSH